MRKTIIQHFGCQMNTYRFLSRYPDFQYKRSAASIVLECARIFSPELTEFRAFLLPDSLYSGVLRVKCENRICRRNLAAIIKVGVNIRCRSDVAMSQPVLDVPQTDTVGVKKAGTAMPLRYNYDKPEKPSRIKGFEVFSLVFSSFYKPKNHTEISRIIGGVSLTTNE